MTPRTDRRPQRRAVLLVSALLLVAGCTEGERSAERTGPPTLNERAALRVAEDFVASYVDPDGRVVRREDAGDTVSEGQAYGMLVAVALEDRERFDRIWSWTQEHLERDDEMFSWRWADGEVVDPMPATDADLDIAHALVLAASKFSDDDYADDARRLADAILENVIIQGSDGPVAVAGPWAKGGEGGLPMVNPSYGAPVAFQALSDLTDDGVWRSLAASARRIVDLSSVESDLPPDWAALTSSSVEPRRAPGSGGQAVHGFDAVRTAIRFAVDCDPDGRALAGAMDDEYAGATLEPEGPAAILTLSGEPAATYGHPASSVAAAAAAQAAGDPDDADRLLMVAERQLAAEPSYYGSAWVALGRLWLSTERLGGCRTR